MSEIEDQLSSLRTRQQEAARRYAQAEAKLDQVKARQAQIIDSLKSQGFESAVAAQAEVARLESEVQEVLAEIESKVSGL